jgi:transcriptional regulator with XRE-family HTH domain
MATAYAQVNPNLIRWARERADLSLGMLARKLQTTEEKVSAWESGAKPITMRKAMELAEKTYIPFGYLFLREQPEEKLPIPDLRTVDSEPVRKPSAELLKVVQTTLTKQIWYKDYALDQEQTPLTFVGRFHVSQWVLARRALTFNYISALDYHRFIAWLKKQYDTRECTSGGPSYYVTLKSQTSDRLARAVLSETLSGHVLLRDAGQLLGLKPDKIAKFAKGYDL